MFAAILLLEHMPLRLGSWIATSKLSGRLLFPEPEKRIRFTRPSRQTSMHVQEIQLITHYKIKVAYDESAQSIGSEINYLSSTHPAPPCVAHAFTFTQHTTKHHNLQSEIYSSTDAYKTVDAFVSYTYMKMLHNGFVLIRIYTRSPTAFPTYINFFRSIFNAVVHSIKTKCVH